jgi:RNA polymerase sigma-70 factor (ECF subfamily)
LSDNSKIRSLLDGCVKNNRNSQKELYYLLCEFAMNTCYRYASSLQEAEELVNEGFVKLYKNIERFQVNRHEDIFSALKGWFKRILINTCIDQYRKNAHNAMTHTQPEEGEHLADVQPNGLDNLSYKEIIEAIRLLSPAYRNVFNLFVIEGLTHDEIAKQLGISTGTSKSNLAKAREKLKKIIFQLTRTKAYA